MASLRNFFANLTTKQRVGLAGSAAAVLVLALVLFRIATATEYTTLMTGIDPAETGKMTAALDEKGVGYELQNNGTALGVEKSQVPAARVALAEQGLPGKGGSKPGFELFDEQKLGASDFQQKVSYQRALEGEIGRTIEQVDGVSGAQVQLVLPEEQLFKDEENPATAAVLLSGDSASLEPQSVRGIAQLVSSSVKGLKASNVSITDGAGAPLWPKEGQAGEDGASMAGTATKQGAEDRYERTLEGRLNAMLMQTVGPGKARVQVKADVDADQSTRETLKYSKKGVALKRQTEKERLRGAGGVAGGASGTAGNIPSYVQGAEGGRSRYDRETNNTDYGVGKEVTRTQIAPGTVNRQGVSLVLDESIPPSSVPELRRAIESAAGIDAERGDTLAVSQVPFAKPREERPPGVVAGALDYAKYIALGLAMLLFLFFVSRHLRRREQESFENAEPTWLREIETPMPLAALELPTQELGPPEFESLQAIGDPEAASLQAQVEEVADREPERVAQQVRAWMQAE